MSKPNCMLAQNYFEHKDKVKGKHFIITEKLDGVRCIVKWYGNEVIFESRNGKRIEGLVEIEKEIKCLPAGYVYDGELLVDGAGFEKTSGEVRKKGIKTGITFHIFDTIPGYLFEENETDCEYNWRRRFLNVIKDSEHIKIVPVLYSGQHTPMIDIILEEVTKRGGEGIMINLLFEYYEKKRSFGLFKVKKFKQVELPIKAINIGTGKYSNTLGSITCEWKGKEFQVGSGFTDYDRHEIWKSGFLYIGMKAIINYFEESKNTLRFPTFKGIRYNFIEESIFDKIAEDYNCKVNQDNKDIILQGLVKTGGYCPCVPKYLHNEDTKCPCSNFKATRECKCKLFERKDD